MLKYWRNAGAYALFYILTGFIFNKKHCNAANAACKLGKRLTCKV